MRVRRGWAASIVLRFLGWGLLLQHCSLKSRGCHPLIASCNAGDRLMPWLWGSILSMLRKCPGMAPFFGTCKGGAAIVALGSRQCVAGCKLSVPQLREGFCAWMQRTSLKKNITGKEAGVRFSQPAVAAQQTEPSAPWFCSRGRTSRPPLEEGRQPENNRGIRTLGHEFWVLAGPVLSVLIGAQHPPAGPR